MSTSQGDDDPRPLPPVTAPSFQISCRGLDEETANRFGPALGRCIQTLSRYFDLERLDGVTVAADYPAALAALDRGFETSHVLAPTTETAVGVAMTPAVMRNGIVKAHILLNAAVILPLENEEDEFFQDALFILAHECAHVTALKALDQAFPGLLLRHRYEGNGVDLMTAFGWQITDSCWDEYAASRMSAIFGTDRTSHYEEIFLDALGVTRDRANAHIREYRLHGDHGRVLAEVASRYGELMRFASYLLGHLHGADLDRDAAPDAMTALQGHWFGPHFDQLEEALADLWADFGTWQSRDEFAVIGSIVEQIINEGGVRVRRLPHGELYVHVPYTAGTMPMPA